MTLSGSALLAERSGLARTLERVSRLGDGYELQLDPKGDDCIAADQLVGGGPPFERVVRRLEGHSNPVTRRAAGSQFVLEYLRFAWPAITAFALERRVPDVAAENLVVRLDSDGMPVAFGLAEPRFAVLSGDSAASDAAFVARDDEELLAWLCERAVDRNAAPLIERVRSRLLTSGTALWGNVAAAFVHPLLWHLQLLATNATSVVRDAEAILGRPVERNLYGHVRLLQVVHGETELTVHARRTCCLRWCLPGESRCADCPLVREPEASEFLRAKLAEAIERGEALRAGIGTTPQPALP